MRRKEHDGSSTTLAWRALVLLQLGWTAAVVAVGGPLISIVAPAVFAVATASLAFSIYRFRTPTWRETSWWRAKPLLRAVAGGDLGAPSFQGRAGQFFAAAMQLVFGVFMTVIGVLLLLAIAA
jgi:hypothetical protein